MYFSLTSIGPAAADLSFLLRKHPDKVQRFDLPTGVATVFFPESSAERAEMTMVLTVDPIELIRNKSIRHGAGFPLGQFVNDRPYATTSLVSHAVAKVFSSAMTGGLASDPEAPFRRTDITLRLPALPVVAHRELAGADLVRALFEPLGWTIAATPLPADPQHPEWGDSRYLDVTLSAHTTVADALRQFCALVPVVTDAQHYWVSSNQAEALVRLGTLIGSEASSEPPADLASRSWLAGHSLAELIVRRYLVHQRDLVDECWALLGGLPDAEGETGHAEKVTQRAPRLADLRSAAIHAQLSGLGATSVVDMGCGEGALLRVLSRDASFRRLIGTDVDSRALRRAAESLNLFDADERLRDRVQLLHSSATYRDDRLKGADALVLMEVIEHLDADRLPTLVDTVFGFTRPGHVLVSTPNIEYNAFYPTPFETGYRHSDHRFEFTRAEFEEWASGIGEAYGYTVRFAGIGEADPEHGASTQMAVFTLLAPTTKEAVA